MAGVDFLTVKELMEHKAITMMLWYMHLSRDHQQRAVRAFERVGETIQ
jgi:hypothetical protein